MSEEIPNQPDRYHSRSVEPFHVFQSVSSVVPTEQDLEPLIAQDTSATIDARQSQHVLNHSPQKIAVALTEDSREESKKSLDSDIYSEKSGDEKTPADKINEENSKSDEKEGSQGSRVPTSMNVSVAPTSNGETNITQDKNAKKKSHLQVRRKDNKGKVIESFGTKADKMLKYFPQLFNKDLLLTEFVCGQKNNNFTDKLDPDNMEFTFPDFGFNNELEFEERDDDGAVLGWRRFMDCVSMAPKYERVQNYISFINDKKWKIFQKQQMKKGKNSDILQKQATNAHNDSHASMKNISLLREQAAYQTKTKVVNNDYNLSLTKYELRMIALTNGIKEAQQIVTGENKFIDYIKKKRENMDNDSSDGGRVTRQSPTRRPLKNFKRNSIKKRKSNNLPTMQHSVDCLEPLRFNQSVDRLDGNRQFTFTDWKQVKQESCQATTERNSLTNHDTIYKKAAEIMASGSISTVLRSETPTILTQPSNNQYQYLERKDQRDSRPLPALQKTKKIRDVTGKKLRGSIDSFRHWRENEGKQDPLQNLRTKLIKKLETLFKKISLLDEVDLSLTEKEINQAQQGMKYLQESRLARINPYIHLSILINSKHLTTDQVAENAKLLIEFARKQQFPAQMQLNTRFDGDNYVPVNRCTTNIKHRLLNSYADLAVRSSADPPRLRNMSESKVSLGNIQKRFILDSVENFQLRNGLGSKNLYMTQQDMQSSYALNEAEFLRKRLQSRIVLGDKKKQSQQSKQSQRSYYEPNFFTPPTELEDDQKPIENRVPEKFLAGLKSHKHQMVLQ